MLTMHNVGKIYQTDSVQTHALRDFSLTVNEGEFIAVTGPSGSGKTTFLNIAGLLEPFTSGQYTLDGIDIGGLSDNQRADIRNQKIGYIFQGFNLIPDLNIYENVEVPLRYRGVPAKERKVRILECLEQVGLASRARHLPQQLSGGQQQRVAIARALAGKPRFLLADEPTGNLDTQTGEVICQLLFELNQEFGTTLILVTHDRGLAERCDRTIAIAGGKVAL